ncbi:ABATE domain-containing protein [Kribbella sp. NBC_00709]|uniref:CGNR zinc finger domain-containing protein n=1 Tax=Kribbella sp. NBC_00709 TaxID=2975972 RepID=UPI002E2DBDAE|nr:ABATE domain-containing protein [Kribbella sp. NBC_00709]
MDTRFTWVGGRPSVDFTATVGKRQQAPFERIPEPADLARWFREAGLTHDEVPVSGRARSQAIGLREALYRLFTGTTSTADVEAVNRWSSLPLAGPSLTQDRRVAPVLTDVPALLSTLARDAVELLTGPLAERIRTCASDDCSLLFVDASRAGQRRWCSMNTCGARAKMATYRATD